MGVPLSRAETHAVLFTVAPVPRRALAPNPYVINIYRLQEATQKK